MLESNTNKPILAKAKPQSAAAAAVQEGSIITPRNKLLAANKAKAAAVKAKLAAVKAEATASKVIVSKSPAAAQEDHITPKSKLIAANQAKAAAIKTKLATVKAEATAKQAQNKPHKKYTAEEREAKLLKAIQQKIESDDFSALKDYIAEYNKYGLDKDKLSELLCKKNQFITHNNHIKYENKSALELALFNNISTKLILSNVNAAELEKVISSKSPSYYAESILENISPNSLSTIFKTHYKVGLNILDIALNRYPSKSSLILNIINKVSPEELIQAIVNAKNTLETLVRSNEIAKLIINQLPAVNFLGIQNNEGLNIFDIALDAYINPSYAMGFSSYGNNSTPVVELLCGVIEKMPPKQLTHLLFNIGPRLATLMRSHEIAKLIINKFSAENILEIQSKEVLSTLITLQLYSYHYNDPVLIKMISTIIDNIPYTELTQALAYTKPNLVTFMRSNEIAKSIINKTPAENIPELLFTTISNEKYIGDNFIFCLEYCMSLKTKLFNINALNQDDDRLIDIIGKKYAQTQNKSLLETINNLRKLGSVEPKIEIKIEAPKNDQVLDDIDLGKLDSSDKNKEITREVLRRIDNDYKLTEAQISENINWFKTQDLSGWSNNSWNYLGGRVYSISEVVDLLSAMRNINDRLGINWDFKKVLATAIHIARTSDDKEMIAHLTHTLSELKMCDLGKLINLASVFQVKFNKDIEAARAASINFNEHEIAFLFQNVFEGLKSILESDNNKMAQAVKKWVFEVTDKEVARDNPEKWSTLTMQIHGLFNATLQEIITHKGLNCDTKHFKNLVGQIALQINNIKSASSISNPAINELRKLYILSKDLYFQGEFEKIVQNPDTIEDVFAEFSLNAKSYYGDLSGISHSVYAKVYKKLSDQNIDLAKQFLSTAIEYAFITQNDIELIEQLAQDPSLFDDELALIAQRLLNASEEYKDEEKVKERPQFENEYKYHEPMDRELLGLSRVNEAAALDFSDTLD